MILEFIPSGLLRRFRRTPGLDFEAFRCFLRGAGASGCVFFCLPGYPVICGERLGGYFPTKWGGAEEPKSSKSQGSWWAVILFLQTVVYCFVSSSRHEFFGDKVSIGTFYDVWSFVGSRTVKSIWIEAIKCEKLMILELIKKQTEMISSLEVIWRQLHGSYVTRLVILYFIHLP